MNIHELKTKLVDYGNGAPWYWLSYSEKNYGYQTVSAFPASEKADPPIPGTELIFGENGMWQGDNGVEMIIETVIADIEDMYGCYVCEFIAKSRHLTT